MEDSADQRRLSNASLDRPEHITDNSQRERCEIYIRNFTVRRTEATLLSWINLPRTYCESFFNL